MIDAATARTLCPALDPSGLLAGAIWHAAIATCTPRLMMEALRWACAHGAQALKYLEATGVLAEDGRLAGVTGRDHETGATCSFCATTVINDRGTLDHRVRRARRRRRHACFSPPCLERRLSPPAAN